MSNLEDLLDRLIRANISLLELASRASEISDYDNQWRLEAKAEGVRLAISYVEDEELRLDVKAPRQGW